MCVYVGVCVGGCVGDCLWELYLWPLRRVRDVRRQQEHMPLRDMYMHPPTSLHCRKLHVSLQLIKELACGGREELSDDYSSAILRS
tara:strand:+ start:104 stop:361 length:258 start_codon:yes stop_codon:yes gene_type:complete